MILLKLTRDNGIPVYRQIIGQIVDMIESETLESGTTLPSSRDLADKLGVNRSTVYRAYMELAALGYVESTPGSYTRVRRRAPVIGRKRTDEKGALNWRRRSNPASSRLYDFFERYTPESPIPTSEEVINISPLDLDRRLFPLDDFRRCMNRVLLHEGARTLQYGERAGYPGLREVIARRMQIHGIAASPDEILVTNGAQNAIDLILRLLAVPGARGVVEEPTYSNVIPLLRYHELRIAGVPMLAGGMDLGTLERRLAKGNVSLVYTIPNFQNPTGITTSQEHRERLLALCERHGVPIIEDGFEEEMKYFGRVVLPIKSMDRNQVVLYVGTFSKVLFPGVRIGWIVAERDCIQRLIAIRRFTDLTGGALVQAAVAEFCRLGCYDIHIKRMHRFFRRRMAVALRALEKHMPPGVTWTKPDGGYTIWVDLSDFPDTGKPVNEFLVQYGVVVSPGDYYFHGAEPHRSFRISIASLDEREIGEGIERLGTALGALRRRGG
ncbi:MAG TPA: PLP-dependent aminotransferase family protein [Patescibacteria group bacterium]|nr:PLP-dependent aminotransferase family protein [Patescibacteria group bacterium]